MSRQFVLFAALSLLLLVQHTNVCRGRAVSSKDDELAALAKRLRELIADGNEGKKQTANEKDSTASEEEEEEEEEEHEEGHEEEEEEEDNSEEHSGRHESSARHSTRGGGLTDEQKKKVIEIHNKYRKGEQGSNMHKLVYNDNLARLAQEWSDRCHWGHRLQGSFNPGDYGFKSVGENIWAWSDDSKAIPDQPIEDWFNEKNYYNYDSLSCAKEPCGHYTAVVWHSTQEVGCGLTKCSTLQNSGMNDANFFVCNYGPGGNMQREKPYKKGEPCTQCATGKFFCTDGMCDHTCSSAGSGSCECKAKCVRGSVTPDCQCHCNAGASGSDCSETCEDKSPQCGGNPGWPADWCTNKDVFGGMMYDMVNAQCPKMCKKCGAKKRANEELEFLQILKNRMADEKK